VPPACAFGLFKVLVKARAESEDGNVLAFRLFFGDGAAFTNIDSTVATGLTDGTRHTIAIIWTDGVGASFTVDGAALGTAVAAVKTLANAAVAIEVARTLGKWYRVTITNSAGAAAFDAGSVLVYGVK